MATTTWPSALDYQDAMQSPPTSFQLVDLKAATVALDQHGFPRVASGNFASVYELSFQNRRWGIRCLLREQKNGRRHYQVLSQYLGRLHIDSMVAFEYLENGILIKGHWFPIIRMDWVSGVPLNQFIGLNKGRPDVLGGLADSFRDAVETLQQNHIAHGDLQHANILVEPGGELRFVDYDAMFLPAFAGELCPELGHANFQHPKRTPECYDQTLDNFSALTIYLSILAVAANGRLWDRYQNGDNLLFSAEDFRRPAHSPVLHDLQSSPSDVVRELATQLEESCLGEAKDVPAFQEITGQEPDPVWAAPAPDAPGCVLFLIDQSAAMTRLWGDSKRPASEVACDMVNRFISRLAARYPAGSAKGTYDLGLLGYSSSVVSAIGGRLQGRMFASLDVLAASPATVENRMQRVTSTAGSISTLPVRFPVWVRSGMNGPAMPGHALIEVYALLQRWIATHQDSPPPVVVHVSGADFTDRMQPAVASKLLRLKTKQGAISIFNIVPGRDSSVPMLFPEMNAYLGSSALDSLLTVSSRLPAALRQRLNGSSKTRCLAVNARPEDFASILEALLGA